MRRFSLIMAVVAVLILCLGISSTAMAARVIRINLVDTAGGTAAGHAEVLPTIILEGPSDRRFMAFNVVGRGLAQLTSYIVGFTGVVNTPQGPRLFIFSFSSTTTAAGVLTLHDSFAFIGSIVSVNVTVSSGTSSDPALFGIGVMMIGTTT